MNYLLPIVPILISIYCSVCFSVPTSTVLCGSAISCYVVKLIFFVTYWFIYFSCFQVESVVYLPIARSLCKILLTNNFHLTKCQILSYCSHFDKVSPLLTRYWVNQDSRCHRYYSTQILVNVHLFSNSNWLVNCTIMLSKDC